MNPNEAHLTWTHILESIDTPEAVDSILAHLEGCLRCTREFNEAKDLVRLLELARLPVLPDALAQDTLPRVLALARERAFRRAAEASPILALPASWLAHVGGALRELAASLVADSLRPTQALRAASTSSDGSPRVLKYEAGEFALSISLSVGPKGRKLRGQVTPRSAAELPESRRALLHVAGQDQAHDHFVDSEVSEFGEFVFDAIPAGEVRLSVLAGSDLIQVEVKA